MTHQIIIDTDPGIDDAIALGIALFDAEIEVRLITTVAGNVNVERTNANALRLLAFWGKKVAVAKGAGQPLLRALNDAARVHGESGLAGFDFQEKADCLLPLHAVEAMRQTLLNSSVGLCLIALGPLTNIALLLTLYPEVKAKIARIILMGGSTERGNKTPMAEFNMVCDPEAAAVVFASGVELVMCGMNLGRQARVSLAQLERIKTYGQTGALFYRMLLHYREGSPSEMAMYDSTAIAYLLRPELFSVSYCNVEVECKSDLTLGCTVVDLHSVAGRKANAWVCTEVNSKGFADWFEAAIKRIGV